MSFMATPAPALVRLARPDELAAVGELTVAAYADHIPSSSRYVQALRDATSRAEHGLLLVATDPGGRLVLSTLPSMAPALRLYERLGSARAPTLDRSPVPGVDLLGYALDLEPQSGT